jgi:hypothetical protein
MQEALVVWPTSLVIGIIALAMTVGSVVHATRRRQWGWVGIVVLLPVLGSIVYWISEYSRHLVAKRSEFQGP